MLSDFIIKAIEGSNYTITSTDTIIEQSNEEIKRLKVDPGQVTVDVTPQNTYKLQGSTQHQNELKEIIDEGIKPYIRQQALEILKKGCDEWNEWRTTHGQLKVDFTQADFSGKNFANCDFKGVIFNDANLSESNLSGANFNGCQIRRADLRSANLENTDLSMLNAQLADFSNAKLVNAKLYGAKLNATTLINAELKNLELREVELNHACLDNAIFSHVDLSGVIINEETSFENAKGIEEGINGIWNSETDTAGLLSVNPPGNSMKGSSHEAVLESLKRSRKYLGFSFLLSVLTALIIYLDLKTIQLPYPRQLDVSVLDYYRIASAISIGFLILSKTYMDDAFEGMKYLESRKSVMQVASFPWPISRYMGEEWHHKFISYLLRIALALHPLIYLFVFNFDEIKVYEVIILVLIISLSFWILVSSQRFQQPILFDRKMEEKAKEESIVEKLDKINETLKKRARSNR